MKITCYQLAACLLLAARLPCCAADQAEHRDAKPGVTRVNPEIIRVLPHDTEAYTQGLVFYDGFLYESSGGYGTSSLRRIDPTDGEILDTWKVKSVFAEGITVQNQELTLLTWRAEKAVVYSLPEMKAVRVMQYDGEGWGLTSANDRYIMSNGTNVLYFRDDRFIPKRRLKISFSGKPLRKLNELEYVNGRLYANVLHSKSIAEIDIDKGTVARIINCKELLRRVQPTGVDDVLNGIAWRPSTETFYLTGKNWKHLFEVRIPKEE